MNNTPGTWTKKLLHLWPGAAPYDFQGAVFVFDFLLRVAQREQRENRFA
jgi:hypothetical protein